MSAGAYASDPSDSFQYCPWEHFDAEWYAASYLRRLGVDEPTDASQHYAKVGASRGYSPNPYFDEGWYLVRNGDARDMVREGRFASGFGHYCAIGYRGRDPHWLFSDGIYRARRGDLADDDLASNGLRNGYHHYLIAGQNELSSGSTFFDPSFLRDNIGLTEFPFTTLLTAPWLGSMRLSHYFDPDWYLAMYEQVEDLIADGHYSSPLHHYLTNPTPHLFAASADFDEQFYGLRNPDITEAISVGSLRTGYQHFVDYGRFENRQPGPWFDPEIYGRDRRVVAALKNDPALTAFDHFLRVGRARGWAAVEPAHAAAIDRRPGVEAAGKDIFLRMAHLWGSAGIAGRIGFPQPAQPDVSVVICVFNQYDLTMQTLLHLSGSTGVSFEVILIDNASIDHIRDIENLVSGLRLIRNPSNVGFLRATNQGIEAARGRHVLLLNNDVVLPPNALRMAVQRLDLDAEDGDAASASTRIGAVGGKVVRTHGQLQEAGCILFSNGSALGYGRDADPFDPEYGFVRDVDYCSGVFLMVRRSLLLELGGLDIDYAPAYYEETDLCVRIWKAGYRVIYDPSVVIVHLEFGSSRNPDAPRALMRRNREIFFSKHSDWLSTKQLPNLRTSVNGRSATRRKRVLFIEDTIPYRHLGSGFVRAADVVASMVTLGLDVTVFPLNLNPTPADPREGFDETVELLWDRDLRDANRLLLERESFYDYVWVCRAHNLHRLASVLGSGEWGPFLHAHVVLDTEALACNRDAGLAALEGRSFRVDQALRRELRQSYVARDICCVNAAERDQLGAAGLQNVHMLGHAMVARPTPSGFNQRRDILALGSLYHAETPNFDGLRWFLAEVWPLVLEQLADARLLIAGFTAPDLDVAQLLSGPRVIHLGFVADTVTLYDEARVFLAPTRFAAGIPYKVHEAASFGLPVMATALIADQLAWQPGRDIAAWPSDAPAGFADALVRLYADPDHWEEIRGNALQRITLDCSQDRFTQTIKQILKLD